MRILFCALKYDYGVVQRGLSFEYYNFFEPLRALGHDVRMLDLGDVGQVGEPGSADLGFLRAVEETHPDLVFSFLFGDELSPEAVSEVTRSGVTTLNWFADDHWRFDSFTRRFAPSFTWVTTTSRSALERYAAMAYTNVIKTQWAAAVGRYRPSGRPMRYDISFVGQRYGDRGDLIERIRSNGLDVRTWGTGWNVRRWHRVAGNRPGLRQLGGAAWLRHVESRTRCSQQEMIDVFSTSRVNLNLSDASQGSEAQIKGRTFEVPACGGFLLTGPADDLEEYYVDGEEIVVFHDEAEMIELARYYLLHEEERHRIARSGYARTLADHTYEKRLVEVLRRVGIED